MDQEVIGKYASLLERTSWILVFFGMLSQVSIDTAFPSYNIALGFWGAYCSFAKHGRATFGFITFCFLSIILDIVFCSINQSKKPTFQFCMAMLIFCMLTKLFALYAGSHFFASIGGAYSMESSMSGSAFDALSSSDAQLGGGYYPPNANMSNSSGNNEQSKSFLGSSGGF